MDRVAGTGHHLEPRVGEPGGQSSAEFAELGIVLSGEHQCGRSDRAEPVPERLLRARAGRTQAGRESGRGVAQTVGSQRVVRGQAGEQRVAEPLVDEGLDPDLLDAPCEQLVGRSAGRALLEVVDAARRSDQYEGAYLVGMAKRSVQRDPTAHRIADVRRVPTQVDEVVGARPEVGVGCRTGVAVPGEVDCDGVDVGETGAQERLEVRPGPCGLGEAVGEDEPLGQDSPPLDCNAILRST